MKKDPPVKRTVVRCAIYTRKSTEEGLDQAFNSLDAQRESAEAYVQSQASEGWVCLRDRYDDGGFTGSNSDRPGLRRLLADIEAGKIDAVLVYKVDRLSRSLLDFAGMIRLFDEHDIAFVSVTQQFNTGSSMGRLVLNVLLSFAQFEREIISERTRDKIAATRRKGKWAGGHPILGYDIDPVQHRLHVEVHEAEQVRTIFALYLEHGSLLPVVEELALRGWASKRWTTRGGTIRGGRAFTRTSLYQLLTNVAYIGRVRYKAEVHPGEHSAIVDAAIWQRVQTQLARNGKTGGGAVRNEYGAILKGILRCGPCQCAMTPSHSTRAGQKRYRYYVCSSAQKRGWQTCPSKSIPAQEIERLVVDQLRSLGRDATLLQAILAQAQQQDEAALASAMLEKKRLKKELSAGRGCEAEWQRACERVEAMPTQRIEPADAAEAFRGFEPMWQALTPREQARIVQLLIECVSYDGSQGKVSLTFRPAGIQTLARERADS